MIKRYVLVLAPEDDEQATSRIVHWVESQRVALASNCTLLTSKNVARSLRAIEEEGENEEKDLQEYGGLEQTTVSKFDVEILGPVSANPLDCVHLPFGKDVEGGDDEEDENNNKSVNTGDSFKVDKLTDLLAVSRVLLSPQDFVGVAYFSDTRSLNTISQTSITNLQRICTQCNIPFATNEVTATLCLQASTKNRRMAVLLFNPVAGQRPAATDLKEIYSLLGHAFNIKVVYTEKDIDVAEQATGVVEWIHGHKEKYLATVGNVDEYVQPLLIASGGDGTVSAIAGATIDSGITVGVIPRGTCVSFFCPIQMFFFHNVYNQQSLTNHSFFCLLFHIINRMPSLWHLGFQRTYLVHVGTFFWGKNVESMEPQSPSQPQIQILKEIFVTALALRPLHGSITQVLDLKRGLSTTQQEN